MQTVGCNIAETVTKYNVTLSVRKIPENFPLIPENIRNKTSYRPQ